MEMNNNAVIVGTNQRTNMVVGSLWMVVITMALFFLPLINGLIGGLVGGYKVGSPGRAMVAAILPSIVAAFGMWLLLVAFKLPMVLSVLASTAVGILIMLSDLGIFIGAYIGGALSRKG